MCYCQGRLNKDEMMDPILKGYVDSFSGERGLSELDDPEKFEYFVNYCMVSKQYPRDFDLDAISVGGSDDCGFDGVAIIVNGNIVKKVEEVDYLLKKNGYLDVSFIFIQSKSSSKFKGEQVGTFVFGLKNFFSDKSSIPENDQVRNLRELKEKIYDSSIKFDSLPALDVYFVSTGEWKSPEAITGRVGHELQDLEKLKIFRSVDLSFVDAERLKSTFRELKRKTVKEIEFSNHVALPEINNVRQSFVGSLAASEYIKLITDDEGGLQKSLFDDNVRDFQGKNKINAAIGSTLNDPSLQAAMVILNNGITVIAKKVELIGKKMKLTDFQIVNGCQSSHVLYENRAKISAGTHIIVKIIETTNQELSSKVIQATNKQTLVTDEAFESLSPFHKDLEEYYKATANKIDNPIYYERRSKQYDSAPDVPASQVMTLSTQIKAYVATTLAQPHSTHRYYGELLEANRKSMFRPSDSHQSYYVSCLALNRLERLLRAPGVPRLYKEFKFQLLYLMHCYHDFLRRNKKGYGFDQILALYNDKGECQVLFDAARNSLDIALGKSGLQIKDAERSREFTNALRAEFENCISS
ncbi:hypothetical protein Q048_01430 [Pseudomonas aeruginosa BWHPSA043]|nr:hypothetical protein Q048_01430 [Pseudomonas aeruginosa BWHPSA043]